MRDRKRKTKSEKTTDLYDSALRCGLIIRRSEGFLCQSLFFGFRSTIRHCRSASLRSQSSVAHWSSAPLYPTLWARGFLPRLERAGSSAGIGTRILVSSNAGKVKIFKGSPLLYRPISLALTLFYMLLALKSTVDYGANSYLFLLRNCRSFICVTFGCHPERSRGIP